MALKAKGLSKAFVWALMGLLFIGLIGFGATNLSGNARSVGTVGDEEIGIDAYSRALQNQMQRMTQQTGEPMTVAQLQSSGLDRQILGQLVTEAALDWEADQIGLSVGDEVLAQELQGIGAFQGPDGQFDREAYAFALDNAGLSEREFEMQLRDDIARSLLQGAIASGNRMPEAYVDTIVQYAAETRDFTFAILDNSDLQSGIPEPSDEDLQAYYDENIERYTRPETKRITYAWVTPDMLVDTVEISEERLREAYEERNSEFNMPARRIVERLVFSSEEAAQDAAARIESGEASFDDLVEARGLDLSDVDLGVVTREDLGDAADAVFDISTGEVAGPAPSPLGPALFRVNAQLAAQETPFEEAQPALRDSLVLDEARQVIQRQAGDYDDRLVGGATLEDLARETDMELGEVDYAGESGDGITSYPAFGEAVRSMQPGDYPAIVETGDGGLFAARVDEVLPEAPRPFEEVRDQVLTGWERARITEALEGNATRIAERLREGATFEGAGLEPRTLDAVSRTTPLDGLPEGSVEEIFTLDEGGVVVLPGQGRVAIVRLDEIVPADLESDQAAQIAEQLRSRAAGDIANALTSAYVEDIQRRAGVEINQQALNAVHSQMQ
ncbi:peptidyl-prolyl cis-trans isomerase [Roseivivax halodurans JCM 10272]|uniref:Parvulin-like PPIase n=1 Tax=Roseivivax halodurans JCM 10272 TaxID=1449350 RepID=X7EL07_9RHOB|nr:peptidyl-prolyl cis-trans isomerase [Roseivivax halodurans]ETX16570.1 peptidyl-prolyl cis-trans isomerase [Roseivivax halodurans JCM 10272]